MTRFNATIPVWAASLLLSAHAFAGPPQPAAGEQPLFQDPMSVSSTGPATHARLRVQAQSAAGENPLFDDPSPSTSTVQRPMVVADAVRHLPATGESSARP